MMTETKIAVGVCFIGLLFSNFFQGMRCYNLAKEVEAIRVEERALHQQLNEFMELEK